MNKLFTYEFLDKVREKCGSLTMIDHWGQLRIRIIKHVKDFDAWKTHENNRR